MEIHCWAKPWQPFHSKMIGATGYCSKMNLLMNMLPL